MDSASLNCAIVVLVLSLGAHSGLPNACPRKEPVPERGRCQKPCRIDSDCVSHKKSCHCDGICGMSCINKNLACPPLPAAFPHGTIITNRKKTEFGTVAKYSCDDGYVLRGPAGRVCQGDQQWSNEEPVCVLDHSIESYTCGPPPQVFNAHHDGAPGETAFDLGTMLRYECDEGFVFPRDSVLRAWCVGGGVWVGPNMTCSRIVPAAGCPLLEGIDNGWVDIDPPSNVGATAVYHCKMGYFIVGDDIRECLAGGKWQGNPPSCEKVFCGPPPNIEHASHNGDVSQKRFPAGKQLLYGCEYGYYKDGESRAMCTSEGLWKGLTLTCSPRNCGYPGDINNGWRNGYAFTYPNKVNFYCHDGYALTGLSTRTCQASGQWDNDVPTCEPVNCPELQAPAYGRLLGAGTAFGTELQFECNDGFHVIGSRLRRCQADRSWSGELARCEEINCGWPSPFYNGFLIGHKTNVGDIIFFSCFVRTTFDGSSFQTTCLPNGQWSDPIPTCWGQCQVPPTANATLVGGKELGYVDHGEEIEYRCRRGLEPRDKAIARNTATVRCNNGTWSSQPQCVPAPCSSPPPHVHHGMRVFLGRSHGFKAKYKCFAGFRLRGMNSTYLTCNYGSWVGGSPHCEEFFCPNPTPLAHGTVYKKVSEGRFLFQKYIRTIKHGQRLEYECDTGFRLEGPSGATCVNGQWRPSLTKPGTKCVPAIHPPFRKLWRPIQEYENYTSRH